MRLENLIIKNFKGIDSLEFKPKSINLIVGKNNTGKTSILESIDLLFNPQHIRQHYNRHFSKLINVLSEYSEIKGTLKDKETIVKFKKPDMQLISSEFKNRLVEVLKVDVIKTGMAFTEEIEREINEILKTALDDEMLSELSKETVLLVADKKEETYSSLTIKMFNVSQKISELVSKNLHKKFHIKLDKRSILNFSIPQAIVGFPVSIGREDETSNVICMASLKLSGQEEIGSEEAIKIHEIEERIKEYKLLNNLEKFDLNFLLFKYGEKTEAIPYDFMGDGFKSMVGFLWKLPSDVKNKIVLLEEPETKMHPGYIKQLIQFIIKFSKETGTQFFITSHSIDFIELFLEEDLSEKEKDYLEKEFLLLRMEKDQDTNAIVPYISKYEEAKSEKNQLFMDLRGL